jgi:DNA-binding NarL/FixJ family response regulator
MTTVASAAEAPRVVLLTPDRTGGEALAIACRRRGIIIETVAPDELRDADPNVLVLDARIKGPQLAEVAASMADRVDRVVIVADQPFTVGIPADAHLTTDAGLDDLVAAVTGRGTRTPSLADPTDPAGLTPRENEVLRALVAGWGTAQMAERLGISQRTVTTHLRNIYAKLGVGSRTEAAAWALAAGLKSAGAADDEAVSGRP